MSVPRDLSFRIESNRCREQVSSDTCNQSIPDDFFDDAEQQLIRLRFFSIAMKVSRSLIVDAAFRPIPVAAAPSHNTIGPESGVHWHL